MRSMLRVLAIALALGSTSACVYLMGDSKDSLAAHPAGTHWDYGMRGIDWEGVDGSNASWVCPSGHKQSPIHLHGYEKAAKSNPSLKTTWSYTPLKSNGSNIQVFNNGHTIQIQWLGDLKSDVEIVSTGNKVTDVLYAKPNACNMKKYQITPLQFHFHTTSEHAVDGVYYPLEMHIVHRIPKALLPGCPDSGCLSVTGILFKISDDIDADNPALDAMWEVMPEQEGVVAYMKEGGVLDIEALMPCPSKRGYYQYEGSLTTPPCSEGLLWHVLTHPVTISQRQYERYAKAVGLKKCEEVPKRRSLQQGEHAHHAHTHPEHSRHHVFDKLRNFQRGAYSGFVHADDLHKANPAASTGSRKLMGGQTGSGSNWKCEIVSFGFTNRDLQRDEGRVILNLPA